MVQSLDFGGLERVVLNIVNALDRRRFHCDVLCLRGLGRNAGQIRHSDTTLFNLDLGRGKNLRIFKELATRITHSEYDIVHSHDTSPLLYTALAKVLYRHFAHVYTEHSGIYSCLPRHRVMTGIAMLSVNRGVMVSKDLQAYFQRTFGVLCPELSVIYNGLEIPEPATGGDTVHAEFGLPPEARLVGTAVRFYPQKGLPYLIKAMPAVLAAHPRTYFILVGDGVDRQALEALTVELGVAERVLFPGYRTDVERLIRSFDIYVLPSLWEGLPLALIEALLAERAVVATAVGGNTEMIEDGKSGFLVPAAESEPLAAKIIALLENDELRLNLAKAGATFAASHLSLSAMMSSYEHLYLNVAGSKN